jgi:hypothetical protein
VVLLQGLPLQVQQDPAAPWFALVLAGSGILNFSIHAWFLVRGDARFRLPASLGVLAATLIISIAQNAVAIRQLVTT